jgi:hypothetical protein
MLYAAHARPAYSADTDQDVRTPHVTMKTPSYGSTTIDVTLLAMPAGCSVNFTLSPILAALIRSGEATWNAIVIAGQPMDVIASCCSVMVFFAVSIALTMPLPCASPADTGRTKSSEAANAHIAPKWREHKRDGETC